MAHSVWQAGNHSTEDCTILLVNWGSDYVDQLQLLVQKLPSWSVRDRLAGPLLETQRSSVCLTGWAADTHLVSNFETTLRLWDLELCLTGWAARSAGFHRRRLNPRPARRLLLLLLIRDLSWPRALVLVHARTGQRAPRAASALVTQPAARIRQGEGKWRRWNRQLLLLWRADWPGVEVETFKVKCKKVLWWENVKWRRNGQLFWSRGFLIRQFPWKDILILRDCGLVCWSLTWTWSTHSLSCTSKQMIIS